MKRIACILLLSGLFCGCSTDFDTIAPWKETMVVYGLLNPNDSIQYIRISKAFLGEGNSLVFAQQSDSIYYGDVLDVMIERFQNNTLLETHHLVKIDTVPKETGTFHAPYQEVYADVNPLYDGTTNDGSIYKLSIFNRVTGLLVTASTKLIEDFPITSPNSTSQYKFNSQSGLTWKFTSSKLGRVYGITQKINYVEINTVTGDSASKSIDWYLGDRISIEGIQSVISYPFESRDLYRLLGGNIAVDSNMVRHMAPNPVDVYVSAGTQELYTYMQVNDPNSGIIQDKPLYTNIVNGVGMFTCRNIRKISVKMHPDAYTELRNNAYTSGLNFQ